ncbi:MAG: hypothetical protein VXZ72_04235, partial [Chlamydiota bacterium]|nr:hypothetical protein [Chlamydiota bacterium]
MKSLLLLLFPLSLSAFSAESTLLVCRRGGTWSYGWEAAALFTIFLPENRIALREMPLSIGRAVTGEWKIQKTFSITPQMTFTPFCGIEGILNEGNKLSRIRRFQGGEIVLYLTPSL